jgi:LysM repeat protein
MIRCLLLLALALISLPLVSQEARAQDITYVHIVRPGETLASIAQTYYGNPTRENVLVAENGLTDQGGSPIVEGLRLVIPTVRYHRVRSGDTWRDLAQRYYGDPNRAVVLIRANEAATPTPTNARAPKNANAMPDEGAQLIIPYPVRHVVKQNETLATLAESYYGKREELRLIKAFNKARIQRGHILLIPLFDLVLSEEGRTRLQAATGTHIEAGETRAMQADVDKKLPALREHVQKGRYAEALSLGNQLLGSGQLTGNQELSIQRELATAYVALGRPDLAAEAFERALEKQPDLELDTIRTSPRVLLALEQARHAREQKKAAPTATP